jgi:nitrile hydratase accessory protein
MAPDDYAPAAPELGGIADYPRRNGEPVFDEPWQSRAFGIVVALHDQGAFEWDEFKERLIAHIADDRVPDDDPAAARYYEYWTAAFYDLALAKGLLDAGEVAKREREFRTGARREVF